MCLLPALLKNLPTLCASGSYHTHEKVALEAEASRARELDNQRDEEAKQDAEAVELGDTTLSLPGSSSDTPPLPEATA